MKTSKFSWKESFLNQRGLLAANWKRRMNDKLSLALVAAARLMAGAGASIAQATSIGSNLAANETIYSVATKLEQCYRRLGQRQRLER
jgi:hypothetical protein